MYGRAVGASRSPSLPPTDEESFSSINLYSLLTIVGHHASYWVACSISHFELFTANYYGVERYVWYVSYDRFLSRYTLSLSLPSLSNGRKSKEVVCTYVLDQCKPMLWVSLAQSWLEFLSFFCLLA